MSSRNTQKRQLRHQTSYEEESIKQQQQQRKVTTTIDVVNVVQFLRNNKNDIDMINDVTGVTPLIEACENNSISDVKALLDQGANVNAGDTHHRTPLMVTSSEGNLEILKLLLDHKSCKKVKSKSKLSIESDDSASDDDNLPTAMLRKLTPIRKDWKLFSMIKEEGTKSNGTDNITRSDVNNEEEERKDEELCSDAESVESVLLDNKEEEIDSLEKRRMFLQPQKGNLNLLKENVGSPGENFENSKPDVNIEAKDVYGWTALMYASLCGKEEVVTELLDRKADINAFNIKKRTSLHVAISAGSIDVAKLLLDRGADINRLDINEWTPAMSAAKHGELEAVKFAIDRGAFVNVNNVSLLGVAAEYGHLELLKFLLERKPRPSLGIRDRENEIVMLLATEHKHISIVQFMLEYGVDINVENATKQTALILACAKGHEEIVNFLLMNNANIFQEDEFGYSAFLYAAKNNLIQIVKLLISKGVKVNSASRKSGMQALMCAALGGHFKLICLLLEVYKSPINSKDFTRKTAFHYSCIGGHAEIAELLIAKGAHYNKDKFNCTPLSYARQNGHFEAAAVLEHKYLDKKILMRADLQPVASPIDILLLTVTSTACYFDIAFDIINAYTFYRKEQYRYFSLALFFQVIPILAAVSLQKGWGTKLMAILHLSVFREFYHSIRGKVETPMMCTLRIIETCLEACPSALLQVYVLISTWLENESGSHSARGFYGFLPSSQELLLFLSILISIGSTSITFIKFVSSEKDRLLMPVKSIVNCFVDITPKLSNVEGIYCYHCCEEVFRLITLAVIFYSLRAWALLAIGASYLIRMILSTMVFEAENFAECTKTRQFIKILLRIALSQITDCLWYNHFKLTLCLQVLTSLEGLVCSLVLLYMHSGTISFSRIQALLVAGSLAWILKTILYSLTYFWMCPKTTVIDIIAKDEDFGDYYSVVPSVHETRVVDAESNQEGIELTDDKRDSYAVIDRKNYFKSIMRSVKKTTNKKFQYNYVAFPPMCKKVVSLLRAVSIYSSTTIQHLDHQTTSYILL